MRAGEPLAPFGASRNSGGSALGVRQADDDLAWLRKLKVLSNRSLCRERVVFQGTGLIAQRIDFASQLIDAPSRRSQV